MHAQNRPHDLSVNTIHCGMEVYIRRVGVWRSRVVAVSLNSQVVVEG